MATVTITHIITRNTRKVSVPAAHAQAFVNTFNRLLEFATID